MSIDPNGFPLDLTAKNPRNEVTGDTRTLATSADKVFVPDGGPFYTDTLIVRAGTRILKPITEYVCLHLIKEATIASGYDVSAVINILDDTISEVTLQYQVVGGIYGETVPVIRQLLLNASSLEKRVNWNSQVYAKPDVFPPAPHYVSGEDFSDWNDVTMALDAINRGLAYKERASWNSFYNYMDALIKRNLATIDLTIYYTKPEVNALVNVFATKESVFTKNEITSLYYNKVQVDSMIGDIDGNEFYYTESEINAKFIERVVADAKFATIVSLGKLDAKKADKSEIYTRAISDDKYALKTSVYLKTYIDATFAQLGLSYTKTEADERFARILASYTKSQSDLRYALKSQIPQSQDLSKYITRIEVDDRYLKISAADLAFLRKTTADALYAKISDLEIINTLIKKFANYYDKAYLDDKFATKVYVANLYYTKVDANEFFASKQYTTLNFLRIADFDIYKRDTAALIATKLDTTFAAATYVEKTTLINEYYNQVFLNDNFATLAWVRKYYLSSLDATAKLKLKLDVTAFQEYQVVVNELIEAKASISYVDGQFYNRAYLDAQFVRKTELTSAVATINTAISKLASYTWVDENYYSRTHINKYYYSSSETEARFYSRTYIDSALVKVSALPDILSPYAKITTVTAVDNRVTVLTNSVYTKVQSDARYLTAAEAAALYVSNTVLNNSIKVLNTAIGAKVDTETLVNDYYTKTQSAAIFATRAYVNSYTYSQSESDTLFMLKAAYETRERDLIININSRMPRTEVESNYVKNTTLTSGYYTKSNIDANTYTRSHIDATFATKASLDALTNKVALKADVARDITTLTNKFSAYVLTTDLVKNYMTSAIINRDFAKSAWVTANFEPKGSLRNYYTKAEADARFALKYDLTREVNALRDEINELRNERQYKVGDIYVTMIGYSSGASVATSLGYGTWVRFGEGRALVGYSEDGYSSGESERAFSYNSSTRTLGATYGYYNEWLSIAQMPSHKHSTGIFNKFSATAGDVYRQYGPGADGYTADGFDHRSQWDEYATGDLTGTMLNAATENTVGGSQSHSKNQPSVVVGVWRRVR